jgi:hypothetical protein
MHSIIPLQTTIDAIGGSPFVILLVLFGMLFTALLSLGVAYLVIRGYRQNRNRARLYLAVGLVLLTTGPIVIQFVLTSATTMSAVGRSAAVYTSKLLGLGALLYAIYGVAHPRAATRTRPIKPGEKILVPLFQLSASGVNGGGLMFVFATVTAAAGMFVASQAYRGYQRNQSRPMLALAVGIMFLTAVPIGVHYTLATLTTATDAAILLAITVTHFGGVAAILYALTRA